MIGKIFPGRHGSKCCTSASNATARSSSSYIIPQNLLLSRGNKKEKVPEIDHSGHCRSILIGWCEYISTHLQSLYHKIYYCQEERKKKKSPRLDHSGHWQHLLPGVSTKALTCNHYITKFTIVKRK